MLQSALWPCGLTLKDILENRSNSSKKRTAAEECLEAAVGMESGESEDFNRSNSNSSSNNTTSSLLTGADASTLGRQGQGKTQRGLLQYACNLILRSSSNSNGNSSNNSNNIRFGMCESRYCMSQEEAGVYGYISGDLEALFAVADSWTDAAFALCHALHVRHATSCCD